MLKLWIALTVIAGEKLDNVQTRMRDDEGATAVEYGLMVALIAVAIIVAVTALGGSVRDKFFSVCDSISGSTCPRP